MKKIYFIGIFSFIVSGCDHSSLVPLEKISRCEQDKYALIWSMNTLDPAWKIKYLAYVGDCLEDTVLAKQLVELDVQQGNYNIIIYGGETPLCPFQQIHEKYPISFHVPIRVQSDVGSFYNEQVKKWIKQDLKVDYDSLLEEEITKCYADIEEE